jgi:hypothetical protein
MGWPCFGGRGLPRVWHGSAFPAPFDEASEEPSCSGCGLPAGLWRGWGLRGGPAAWVTGVAQLRDLRRGFVVVVLCLDAGRTGTQRGREAMQLFPLCGV